MTTTVVISSSHNSLHDLHVHVEKQEGAGWTQHETVVVQPRTTAQPITVDGNTRLVIEEAQRAEAAPTA